jgi:hypothetical protein
MTGVVRRFISIELIALELKATASESDERAAIGSRYLRHTSKRDQAYNGRYVRH